MCDVYDRRMILYRPLVSSLLREVEITTSSNAIEGIHKLVPLSDMLYEFELLVKEAQQCLLDILEKEEDIGDLLLEEYSGEDRVLLEDEVW